MCVEYQIRGNERDVLKDYFPNVRNLTGETAWDLRVKLTINAPVVEETKDGWKIAKAVFPVQPFPNSRLSDVNPKNAGEIDRIYEKPTWAHGFKSERCIVPMTSFNESAYWGPEKGSIVEFSDLKSPVLFAAAIKIKPRVPPGSCTNAFSLLTHTASKQMLNYHQRMLVFLKPKHAAEWAAGGEADALEKFNFLIEHRYIPELEVSTARTMAKGWDKRVESHEDALEEEREYLALLEETGIKG